MREREGEMQTVQQLEMRIQKSRPGIKCPPRPPARLHQARRRLREAQSRHLPSGDSGDGSSRDSRRGFPVEEKANNVNLVQRVFRVAISRED